MQKAIYRIIDANFNRAREALRVIEEFCRFSLASSPLSAAAKALRHELSAAISRLDNASLLACRDSQADVGRGMTTGSDMARQDIYDCFTAAAKRLSEALRALSEAAKTFDPVLAETLEALRFRGYTLEKDIVLAASTTQRFGGVRLYVLLPLVAADDIAKVCDLASACCQGGADCLQLRAKGVTDDVAFDAACRIVEICRRHNVLSIINDRPDIAIASGADGVHLGQNDLPLSTVRQLQPRPLITGLSTHNMDQVTRAITQSPTYIALGPAFATDTKPAEPPAGLTFLQEALPLLSDASISRVAIGGISLENLDAVLETGVMSVAVCSAISSSSDPAKQCHIFKERLQQRYP
jgi:thiamine-phosphate pyrophosphorylase